MDTEETQETPITDAPKTPISIPNVDSEYDDNYKNLTLQVISDNLEDLSMWSVHNEDKWGDMIATMQDAIAKMQKGLV